MSVEIDWFGFAEGAASDTKGNLTLVGFNPNFLNFDSVPGRANLSIVLSLMETGERAPEFDPGDEMIVDIRVVDPSGNTALGMQQNLPVSGKKYPQLPFTATIVFVASIEFRRYGTYTAKASVKLAGKELELEAQRALHIVQP